MHDRGVGAEKFVMDKLREKGFEKVEKKNAVHYDILIDDKIKVEVKGCNMVTRYGVGNYLHVGRFHFANKEQREKIKQQDIWVVFVMKLKEQNIILGFVKGSHLELSKRCISILKVMNLQRLSLDKWAEEVCYEKSISST